MSLIPSDSMGRFLYRRLWLRVQSGALLDVTFGEAHLCLITVPASSPSEPGSRAGRGALCHVTIHWRPLAEGLSLSLHLIHKITDKVLLLRSFYILGWAQLF